MLKMQMGKDAVVSSKEGSMLVNIEKGSKMIAINENKRSWTFIELVPERIEALKKVLPKEIVENEKELFDVKVLTQEEQVAEMMKMMKAKKQ